MTTRIKPMPDPVIDRREDVFTALITKEVRKITRAVQAELRSPLTAAAKPAPAATPTPVPLAQAEATTLGSWQIFVETTAFPFVADSMVDSAGLVVEQMASATGLVIEPITNEFAREYLQSARNRMVNVGLGLWHDIRKELVAGSEAGEGIPEISARLTQFPQVSEYRARMVARTEVISALNAGSYIQMIEYDLGTDVKKEWLATEDPRTRESHRHADNQSVLLVDEFTVGIYSDAVKIGDEGMEFPGDPTATPGNVINCRCTLGYSFDEADVLTAAGFNDFIEAEHPRDTHGKFAKKPGVILPNFDKLTDNQFKSFVKGLTQKNWDSYSKNQQDGIIKRSGPLTGPNSDETVNKLFKLFKEGKKAADAAPTISAPALKARPLGGVDNTSGKPTKPGKPVMLRVKALFGTSYENGAIVAVKPDTNERIIWEDKKMHRQVLLPGQSKWQTTETLTRGALMAKYKDEAGWFTPGGVNVPAQKAAPTAPSTGNPILDDILAKIPSTPAAVVPGKPVKLKVNVLYNKKYQDGEVIAVRPESNERLRWDGKSGKILRQTKNADGVWKTDESLTRGKAYAKYKDEDGWFAPGTGTSIPTPPVKVAPEPSQPVLPAQDVVKTEEPLAPFAKYPINNYKVFSDNPATKVGKLLDTIGEGDSISVRKGPNGTIDFISYETGTKKVSLDAATLTDEKIDAAIADLNLQNLETQDAAQGKYGVGNLKKAVNDDDILAGEVLLAEGSFEIRKAKSPGKVKMVDTATGTTFLLQADTLTDDIIDGIFNEFKSNPPIAPEKKFPSSLEPTGILPSPGNLTFTGKIVGTHHGKIYRDPYGNEWLFKADIAHKPFSFAAVVTANIHQRVGLKTPETGVFKLGGETGSLQRIIPSTEPFGYKFDPGSLSLKDTVAMQKEQIFDWLVSNHDSHAKNFLKDNNGDIFGIDKDQSFRWLGSDTLDWEFQPNEKQQAVNRLWKSFAEGDPDTGVVNPQSSVLKDFINNIESIPDDEYRALVRPYAEQAAKLNSLGKGGPAYLGLKASPFPPNDVEAFLDAAVARKNSLLKDFTDLYNKALKERQANLPAVNVPAPPPVVALAPVEGIKPKSVPFKFNADALIGKTSTTYTHEQVVAEKPGAHGDSDARLVWNANTKKFVLQRKTNPSANTWTSVVAWNKQGAYKEFKDAPGWFTPTQTQDSSGGDTPGTAPAPGLYGAPKPTVYTAPKKKAVKAPKFTSADLQAGAGEHGLPTDLRDKFYYAFRNQGGKFNKSSSPGSQLFKALVNSVESHNKQYPDNKITYLQGLRAVDERASGAFAQNLHLFEKAVFNWLATPSGKANAQKYIDDAKLTPAQKAAIEAAKTGDKLAAFRAIKVSQPHTGPFNSVDFKEISPSEAKAMQTEMGSWSGPQTSSLKSYTGSNYSAINGELRGSDYHKTPTVSNMNHAKNIQEAMKPVPRDILVFRGSSSTQFLPANVDGYKDLIGKTFVDKGFFSTSVGPRHGQVRLFVEVPKGTPAAYVQTISNHPSEQELLLAAGLRFELLSATSPDGHNVHVRVRVVPNE